MIDSSSESERGLYYIRCVHFGGFSKLIALPTVSVRDMYVSSRAGEMQKHYVHSVPCDTLSVCGGDDGLAAAASAQQRRIAVVFRRGRFQRQRTDSGRSSASLAPRVRVPYRFGGDIPDLHEGLTYTRVQLLDMCAHRQVYTVMEGTARSGIVFPNCFLMPCYYCCRRGMPDHLRRELVETGTTDVIL